MHGNLIISAKVALYIFKNQNVPESWQIIWRPSFNIKNKKQVIIYRKIHGWNETTL
jgi:hypothetical protein